MCRAGVGGRRWGCHTCVQLGLPQGQGSSAGIPRTKRCVQTRPVQTTCTARRRRKGFAPVCGCWAQHGTVLCHKGHAKRHGSIGLSLLGSWSTDGECEGERAVGRGFERNERGWRGRGGQHFSWAVRRPPQAYPPVMAPFGQTQTATTLRTPPPDERRQTKGSGSRSCLRTIDSGPSLEWFFLALFFLVFFSLLSSSL